MSVPRPINKPLILFTLIFFTLIEAKTELVEPEYVSSGTAYIMGILSLVLYPILIIWAQALWNTLVPRITGWREITFWETAGLGAVSCLFF